MFAYVKFTKTFLKRMSKNQIQNSKSDSEWIF